MHPLLFSALLFWRCSLRTFDVRLRAVALRLRVHGPIGSLSRVPILLGQAGTAFMMARAK
jgi:hypothetical protein